MNYIEEIAAKIKAELSSDLLPKTDIDLLLNFYAVLLLTKGEKVTSEDVHNAWSAWMTLNNPTHSSILPFNELSENIQLLDLPYVEAIKKVSIELSLS